MHHINAQETPDRTVARLLREAAANASSHLLRLKLLSKNFETKPEQFEGVERDFFISIVYSMNEAVSVLCAVGGQVVLDAIALANPDAMEYYDNAINTLHKINVDAPELQTINEAFAAEWERVRPAPVQPEAKKKRDAELEKTFKDDDVEPRNRQERRAAGVN